MEAAALPVPPVWWGAFPPSHLPVTVLGRPCSSQSPGQACQGTAWGAGASREAPPQLSGSPAGSRSLSLVGGPSERGDLTCSSLEKAPNEVAEPGLTRESARQGVRLGRGHRNPVLSLNDMSLTS